MKKRFKTNAKCGGCVAKIGEQLNKMAEPEEWSIDLASPEKLLMIDTDEPSEAVVRAVSEAGFKAEPLDLGAACPMLSAVCPFGSGAETD